MEHKTVVRNQAYQTGSFNTIERHNERKNAEYFNGDVKDDREHLNVHFKRCFKENGEAETYQETFNRLLAEKKIVKHGTKADAKLFCEFVFDINTTYFDERGGYEYAKSFFEEAYRMAVKEAGSEDYIISAVMHADERNSMLSEKLGRDIYHYHLHVVYVPVVEKKCYFRKDNADPEKAGKLKEVIPQISQSNKWPLRMTVERDGKTVTRNSYSFLQDRYYEHMKAAGFEGFERGERGSTTEHLEVLEYKIQQDRKELAVLDTAIQQKQQSAAALDEKTKTKEKKLEGLEKKTALAKKEAADFYDIENMGGKRTILGGIALSQDDWEKVSGLAKEAIKSRGVIKGLKDNNNTLLNKNKKLEESLGGGKKEGGIQDSLTYYKAKQRAPLRMAETIADIMRQPPERKQETEQEHSRNTTRREER